MSEVAVDQGENADWIKRVKKNRRTEPPVLRTPEQDSE